MKNANYTNATRANQGHVLHSLILETMTEELLKSFDLIPSDIIRDIERTRNEFCPDKTLAEVFTQEKEYWIQHGMNPLDCGYTNKKLA